VIEVVYTLVTALVVRRLLLDTNAKAAQARRLLVSIGWLQYVQSPSSGPRRGRACRGEPAYSVHPAAGLESWLVLVTMPAHSATNLAAVRLMKQRSVILMETIVVVVGAVAFALGLLAWQR
jgi:hypothetical protein